MLKLKKVAVTGGLACGKSSACRILKELGAYVVSADEIVHQLLSPATALGNQIIELIGPEIVINGQIDRYQISKKVFKNPQLLQSLEHLLHPAVRKEIERHYQQASLESKAPLFVAEIPLLFESNESTSFDYDYCIAVIADQNRCEQRFQEATGYGKAEFAARSARQLDPSEKAKRADFVIFNNGSKEDLYADVQKTFSTLKKLPNKESNL